MTKNCDARTTTGNRGGFFAYGMSFLHDHPSGNGRPELSSPDGALVLAVDRSLGKT
jgi:hypothetical protein